MTSSLTNSRAWLLVVVLATSVVANDDDDGEGVTAQRRVEVTVTAASGGAVYLDKGRSQKIEVGDAVELWPLSGPTVFGVISFVSYSSSRVELPAGAAEITPGVRGEVRIPESRFEEPEDERLPPRRPWTSEEVGYDTDQPLLAPLVSVSPGDREAELHGRVFFQFSANDDRQNGNTFGLWRTGVDARVRNPFGRGGELRIDGEVFRRSLKLDDGDDSSTTRGKLDRAYYAWGGTREAPDSWRAGRFVQHAFSELGVLDGVEYAHRVDDGALWGASFGAMPEPFPEQNTGEDVQAAVFYRREASETEPTAWGVAYQNTWHRGEQDRNLLVGTVDSRVSESGTLHAVALVDYYGPGDTVKDDGLELTEAHVNALWRTTDAGGVGVHATHLRWPELKRNQFGDLTNAQLLDNRVTRVGLNGWQRLSDDLRLDARLDSWFDQDDDGESGSLRTVLRDVFGDHDELSAEVFFSQGATTDARGLRLGARSYFERLGSAALTWELTRFDQDALVLGEGERRQQALRASLDSELGDGCSLSLFAERRTGDDVDSYNYGVFLQERF